MTILYLYAELMGYQIPILKEYVNRYKADVHVVHWDHKKLTPYIPPPIQGVSYYNRSEFNIKKLIDFSKEIKPDIVYVSGWMDKGYLSVCKILKKKGVSVVAGSDTQIKKTLRQKIGVLFFKFYLNKHFTHIWIPGPYQFEYAKKLGFENDKIIFNCLSADNKLFKSGGGNSSGPYPHKFLFLGRFEDSKGVKYLLQAWKQVQNKKDWTLTFIGNGSLKDVLLTERNVEVRDFQTPEELARIINQFGFLVLPSISEPWALVIQEAMAAGLPVLATKNCGAAPVFIIHGYTGYLINSKNSLVLKEYMELIINTSDPSLRELSKNAFNRADIITPEISAASFTSILNYKN